MQSFVDPLSRQQLVDTKLGALFQWRVFRSEGKKMTKQKDELDDPTLSPFLIKSQDMMMQSAALKFQTSTHIEAKWRWLCYPFWVNCYFTHTVDNWEMTKPKKVEEPRLVTNSSVGLCVTKHRQLARWLSQTFSISNLGRANDLHACSRKW